MAKKKLVQLVNSWGGGRPARPFRTSTDRFSRFFPAKIDRRKKDRRFPKKISRNAANSISKTGILQAKINEEYQQQKTLEKPEVKDDSRVRASSSSSLVLHRKDDVLETVPPAPASKLPLTVGGEDKDPVARERRDKVKEVSTPFFYSRQRNKNFSRILGRFCFRFLILGQR